MRLIVIKKVHELNIFILIGWGIQRIVDLFWDLGNTWIKSIVLIFRIVCLANLSNLDRLFLIRFDWIIDFSWLLLSDYLIKLLKLIELGFFSHSLKGIVKDIVFIWFFTPRVLAVYWVYYAVILISNCCKIIEQLVYLCVFLNLCILKYDFLRLFKSIWLSSLSLIEFLIDNAQKVIEFIVVQIFLFWILFYRWVHVPIQVLMRKLHHLDLRMF